MTYLSKLIPMVLMTGFALAAYGNQTSPSRSSNFELIILHQNWFELQIGYDAEPAQITLKSADTHDPLFTVTTDHIEKYDWNVQTLMFTQQGTDHLIEVLGRVDGREPNGITELRNLKESLDRGNPIERALYLHAFLIQVDNQVKYGGIFLDAPSQMAINFPVIRVTMSDGKAIMALLPTHIPFVMIDPIDDRGRVRKPVVAEEAKHDVQQFDFFLSGPLDLPRLKRP